MIEKEPPNFTPLSRSSIRVGWIAFWVIVLGFAASFLAACQGPQMPLKRVVAGFKGKCATRARITFYTDHRTASGKRPRQGETVAAHPKYKFGTEVEIPELKPWIGDDKFIVQDRGSAVTSRKASRKTTDVIDVYVRNYATMKKLERDAPEYMDIIL